MNQDDLEIIQWIGAGSGLAGTALLAARNSVSRFGWLAYFVSNIAWGYYAFHAHNIQLLAMQMGFMAFTALGIYRWLVKTDGGAVS